MRHLPACPEHASLSQHERDLLNQLPQAANEINFTVLWCELQAGHPGPHAALGQMYGARARWLGWVMIERHDWVDIADNEFCAAVGPPVSDIPNDLELCLLPAAHPGGHSFEIARTQP